jgi:hypothetical protein
VRKSSQPVRPRYHHHRAIDDAHGVITAVETTPGNVAENQRLLPLIDQHQTNTGQSVTTAVGDHKYGTVDNLVACAQPASAPIWANCAPNNITPAVKASSPTARTGAIPRPTPCVIRPVKP